MVSTSVLMLKGLLSDLCGVLDLSPRRSGVAAPSPLEQTRQNKHITQEFSILLLSHTWLRRQKKQPDKFDNDKKQILEDI